MPLKDGQTASKLSFTVHFCVPKALSKFCRTQAVDTKKCDQRPLWTVNFSSASGLDNKRPIQLATYYLTNSRQVWTHSDRLVSESVNQSFNWAFAIFYSSAADQRIALLELAETTAVPAVSQKKQLFISRTFQYCPICCSCRVGTFTVWNCQIWQWEVSKVWIFMLMSAVLRFCQRSSEITWEYSNSNLY